MKKPLIKRGLFRQKTGSGVLVEHAGKQHIQPSRFGTEQNAQKYVASFVGFGAGKDAFEFAHVFGNVITEFGIRSKHVANLAYLIFVNGAGKVTDERASVAVVITFPQVFFNIRREQARDVDA